jgi:transcriptional regulator with XRE-family HTH domain
VPERTLAQVIGANVKKLREETGLRQADFAELLKMAGLVDGWTRDTMASVEAGRRALSVDELIVLGHISPGGLVQLFAGEGPVQIAGTRAPGAKDLDLDRVRAVIVGGDSLAASNKPVQVRAEERKRRGWKPSESGVLTDIRIRTGAFTREEAAKRLGVPVKTIDRMSERLWGQSLWHEHVDRVRKRVPKGASGRSIDATRGHVTRQLLAELREELKKKGPR